jgi:hypothetical protein
LEVGDDDRAPAVPASARFDGGRRSEVHSGRRRAGEELDGSDEDRCCEGATVTDLDAPLEPMAVGAPISSAHPAASRRVPRLRPLR